MVPRNDQLFLSVRLSQEDAFRLLRVMQFYGITEGRRSDRFREFVRRISQGLQIEISEVRFEEDAWSNLEAQVLAAEKEDVRTTARKLMLSVVIAAEGGQ